MKKNIKMPYDSALRFLASEFPEEFHKNLKLPGKFKKILENDVIGAEQKNLRMDLVEEIEEYGERISAILNIEHQSTKLNKKKMEVIMQYKIYYM